MKYRVLKPFINIDGAFLRVNDAVSCTPERAGILRKNSMIGGVVETAAVELPQRNVMSTEDATDRKPKQRRKRKRAL